MKDFFGFSLIAGGVIAMAAALFAGLAGINISIIGGWGLLAAVIGAAIVGKK